METLEIQEEKEVQIPISEIFASPQGEGVFCGQMQIFVRTAGCTVGKPFPKEMYETKFKDVGPGLRDTVVQHPMFPIYTEKCTFADGRTFACDTDYTSKMKLSQSDILSEIEKFEINDVCFTGGEPLMHQRNLKKVMRWLKSAGYVIHLETSGTIQMDDDLDAFWVTVSPKMGVLESMLVRANEIKILVDEYLDIKLNFPFDLLHYASLKPVFLQPVNFEHSINPQNLKRCLDIQKEHPSLRVSLQLHKVLSHYVGERIL